MAECGGNGNDARSGKVGWRSNGGGEKAAERVHLPRGSALLLGFEGEPPWTISAGKYTLLPLLTVLFYIIYQRTIYIFLKLY